jgi:phosphopantothenoylcysteine decarboxylase/phosphopantothenate--cysteine ligase
MKEVLLIITGSVSAFKSLELIRLLKKDGINVRVVLTKGGMDFITPLSASALSGNEVITADTYKMEHITLSRNADLIVVCPASASFINKLSSGVGGEIALDLILAKQNATRVMLFPAMNPSMWLNQSTKESIKTLERRDFIVINPAKGKALCDEEGEGKLPEIGAIHQEIIDFLVYKESLKGKKFLITNGATVERIDDARFVSNFSSGLQGALIAKEILKRGGEVFVVEGKTSYDFNLEGKLLHKIKVEPAIEMLDEVLKVVHSEKIEGFFAVSAVADFRVKNKVKGKLKKDEIQTLELEKNPDILKEVATLKSNRPKIVVGFSAEEEKNLLANGKNKLHNKNCDFLFTNSMCFGVESTTGYLLSENLQDRFSGLKLELAKLLIGKIFIHNE